MALIWHPECEVRQSNNRILSVFWKSQWTDRY